MTNGLSANSGSAATRMRVSRWLAGPVLLVTIAACGEAEPSADDMINDASDTAAAMEASSAEISAELKSAAANSGDMPCGLPMLPGARASRSISPDQSTFNTGETPEMVAAFYRAAAEAREADATLTGIPGLTEVEMALGDQGTCKATAQAQPTGDTNVTITRQP